MTADENSDVRPVPGARVAAYAEAMFLVEDDYDSPEDVKTMHLQVNRVMAVADAEQAELRAEVDEYRKQWHQEVENFERETVRAEAAEAEWEKWQDRYGNLRTAMEALADEWENRPHPEGAESSQDWVYRMHASSLGSILRAALASAAPAVSDEPSGRVEELEAEAKEREYTLSLAWQAIRSEEAARTTAEAERDEAREDAREYDGVLTRQGETITRVVNALKGDPPPLTTWSHHDAADMVEGLVKGLRALAYEVSVHREYTGPHDDRSVAEWNAHRGACVMVASRVLTLLDGLRESAPPAVSDGEGATSEAGLVDRHGDVWREGGDGLMHSFETAPFPREHVEKKWGPLRPASPVVARSATDAPQAPAEQGFSVLSWVEEIGRQETAERLFFVDKDTGEPCPTMGNRLCTITDPDHRHKDGRPAPSPRPATTDDEGVR